jgi:hypothetical protein
MPVDASLLERFAVLPCTRASLEPANAALNSSFQNFFRRAADLYRATFGAGRPIEAADKFERQTTNEQENESESFAWAVFGIDTASRRITVGDAFVILEKRAAPKPMCDFMLRVGLKFGLGISLLDAFSHVSKAIDLETTQPRAAAQRENERLRRVADAALALSGLKRARNCDQPSNLEVNKMRVKPLLEICGLKISQVKADLPTEPRCFNAFADVVNLLAAAVTNGVLQSEQFEHACAAAMSTRKCGVLRCIGAAVCVLRASANPRMNSVFAVVQTDNIEGVSFNRVLPSGSTERVTAGCVVDSPKSSVVLVRVNGNSARLRLTKRER